MPENSPPSSCPPLIFQILDPLLSTSYLDTCLQVIPVFLILDIDK